MPRLHAARLLMAMPSAAGMTSSASPKCVVTRTSRNLWRRLFWLGGLSDDFRHVADGHSGRVSVTRNLADQFRPFQLAVFARSAAALSSRVSWSWADKPGHLFGPLVAQISEQATRWDTSQENQSTLTG
jgi:hypothetical protein